MPLDFPDIDSVIRRVCKPVDEIIRQVLNASVDARYAPAIIAHIKTMPRHDRVQLAEGLEILATAAGIPITLYGRGKYFREPIPHERDEDFRNAAADWMRDVVGDTVEASEIRTGRGWNKQTPLETLSELPGGLELLAEMLDASSFKAKSARD